MRRAVFLDRDGTINIEAGYISHPDNLKVYPFAGQAIRLLNIHDFLVFIVTNQAGIAKGLFDKITLDKINSKLLKLLKDQGASIDQIYYCPHLVGGKIERYAVKCDCRKPEAGLIKKAFSEFDIDKNNIYLVGDKHSDIEMSRYITFKKTYLVKTGYGLSVTRNLLQKGSYEVAPGLIADNLLFAVLDILKQ